MKEKVSVFLGSTYSDLKDHRKEVIKSLTKIKKDVNAMEFFGAQPDTPINVCLEKVRESSLYIGIFAMKYGSIVEGTGKSFTQLEYEEAQRLKLPSLIYISGGDSAIGENAEKLIDLKKTLKKEFAIGKFTTPDNLAKQILEDLPLALKPVIDKTNGNRSCKFLNNVPVQDTFVVGRDNDLKKIREMLDADQSLILMNGLGGIGKTTLARKYIVEYMDDFDNILWLEASQGVKDAFFSDQEIHTSLDLTDKIMSMKPEEAFSSIMYKLKNLDGHNLIVLDDVKADFASVKNQLPGKPNWKLLVTSRQNFTGIETYHLDFLKKEDAFLLFYKYYTAEKDDELLEKIFKPVKYHTLVVELFAKMAMMNGLSLSELAAKADAEGITISIPTEVNVDHSEENIENILEYLMRTFPANELQEELVIVLRKLAIMPSGFYNIDDLDYLLQIEEVKKEGFHLNLNKLMRLGWLEKAEREYKVHEIIRQLVLKEYPPEYEFYEDYIIHLVDISHIDQNKDNVVEKFFIIPFCLYVIMNIPNDKDWLGYLIMNTASLLSNHGNYSEALMLNLDGLKIAQKTGNNELECYIMSSLGSNYENIGEYVEARKYLEKVLNLGKEIFGDIHPNIVSIMSSLANFYRKLGEFEKALDLLEKALKLANELFDEKHMLVAVCQTSLGLLHRDMGEFEKAGDLLEKVLKSDIEKFGEKHPDVAVDQSNLANLYKDLGEYKKASILLEHALQSDIENFGEDHPKVATRKSNLALVYSDLGDYVQACDLLEQALKSDIEIFGEKHPKVVIRQSNLASVYQCLGEYAKARDLLELALESTIEIYGEKHPDVVVFQSNLGLVLKDLGELTKSRELLASVLESNIEHLSEKHPTIATDKSNLALVLTDLGEYQRAQDLLEQALNLYIDNFGEKHPNVATCRSNLALVYQNIGEHTKAHTLLNLALKFDIESFGEEHPKVATRYTNLGTLFVEMKDYDLAWDYYQKALSIAKLVWGEKHPSTITIKNSIENLIKLMTSNVLAGKVTEVSDALSNIKESLRAGDVETKRYIEFLEVIIIEGDAQECFEKLPSKYKKLVIDVQNKIQLEALYKELNKYTVMAIQTHADQEDHLDEIRGHISKLEENIHPEVRKYYDFLLEYAAGKDLEELKGLIDEPLWEMFIKIKNGEHN